MHGLLQDLVFDVAFIGLFQALLALVVTAPTFLVCVRWFRMDPRLFVRRFALFNLIFFCWSILGNAIWLHLTSDRLVIADDAPVWAAFLPFGAYVLDHAAGWRDGWHLLGGTTLKELKWIWAATAFPVWLLAILSMFVFIRARGSSPSNQPA
jgi:hypothetical protein